MTHFRALDTDGSGRLEAADLQPAKSKTPEEIERIMTEGAPISTVGGESISGFEIPQYPYVSEEARREASVETDRAIAVGHMECVPI